MVSVVEFSKLIAQKKFNSSSDSNSVFKCKSQVYIHPTCFIPFLQHGKFTVFNITRSSFFYTCDVI